MARKPRLHYPGGYYHVVLRAAPGVDLFTDETDKDAFLELLAVGLRECGYHLHGHALGRDRFELIIEIGDLPLSSMMQKLALRFTRYAHRRHGFEGSLFQGRYLALLFDPACHLETVQAHLKALEGHGDVLSTPVWPPAGYNGQVVGSKQFRALVAATDSERTVPQTVEKTPGELLTIAREILGISPQELTGATRARRAVRQRCIFTAAVQQACGHSLSDVARLLKRDVSSLSRNMERFRGETDGCMTTVQLIRAMTHAIQST
ncbi:MAG: hypothetical protein EP335_15045 [Alphaproteobacteria bacterium]|nr:MAG: hypothetical protein EP335_15045 [Alphaproteobacteria bacterium]